MTTASRTSPGRRLHPAAVAVGVAALLAVASPAGAHVTVQPGEVEGGGYSVVAFRVPNERDDASTTRVTVRLPEEPPIASVGTTPVAGWRVAVEERRPSEPLEVHGEPVDTVASTVTWTATGAGIEPGQFQDFELSLGPLPASGELVLPTVQRYSSGEEVAWDEVAVQEGIELERPAPVLTLTAPEIDAAQPVDAEMGEDPVLPTVLSASALAVSLVALALALRARRRRA